MFELSKFKKELKITSEKILKEENNVEIHKLIEKIIIYATDAEYASVWIFDGVLLIREREDGITTLSFEKKEGLLYQCFAMQEVIVENHLSSAKGYIPHIDNPDNIKIKSKMMIPLIVRDTFIGIVTVYTSIKKKKNFTKNDLEVFEALKPLVIDGIFRMNHNSGNGILVDRRKATKNTSGFNRRKSDMIEKLESLEVKKEQRRSPEEILEITSNIVHDIRTPANGLLGFLEILGEKIEDKRLKEYISHAQKSAALIETLTTSILDGVSQKSAPVSSKGKEMVGVHRFFAEIAEVFSANMYKKNIDYTIYIDPYLPKMIELDSMKMKRVILNLIGNASKFTPEGASIAFFVVYKPERKQLHISVEDTGIGIAKEKQKDIFEAFQQAEENTKEKFGGTGLGLAICASYVKEMGGELLLKSELDKGSIFYFDIPLGKIDKTMHLEPLMNQNASICIVCDKSNTTVMNVMVKYLLQYGLAKSQMKAVSNMMNIPQDTSHLIVFENKMNDDLMSLIQSRGLKYLVVEENFLSLDAESYSEATLISQYAYYGDILYTFINNSKMPKILVVEDDRISSMLLISMLEDEYCEIDVAFDGEEGKVLLLKALNANVPYDVVYADENMPLLSGGEMIKAYKELEKSKNINSPLKTVSISGKVNESIDGGGFDFLATKPFNKKEIVAILHDCVG